MEEDEFIDKIEELHSLREKTNKLNQLKSQSNELGYEIDQHDQLNQQILQHQKQLELEKMVLLQKLNEVQLDLDKISVQKLECESGRIELSEKLNSLHKNELEPLQTDINSLRLKYGLSKLKSLQEEKEDAMKKYLENRRSRGERSTEVTNAEHAQKPKRGPKKQRRS